MAYDQIYNVHVCDCCEQVSDDGLVTVVVTPAEPGDRDQPRIPALIEDWCASCRNEHDFFTIVRDDDDDDARDNWEADAYDR